MLRSCSAVSDSLRPLDCSPPGSSVHRIFQARILEWVAFPPPGYLPDPGIEPASTGSSALQVDSSPPEPLRKPCICSLCVFLKTDLKSFFFPLPGLCCCSGFSLVLVSRGYSVVAGGGLLFVVASLVAEKKSLVAQALGSLGCSNCDSWALENRLNNCRKQA